NEGASAGSTNPRTIHADATHARTASQSVTSNATVGPAVAQSKRGRRAGRVCGGGVRAGNGRVRSTARRTAGFSQFPARLGNDYGNGNPSSGDSTVAVPEVVVKSSWKLRD